MNTPKIHYKEKHFTKSKALLVIFAFVLALIAMLSAKNLAMASEGSNDSSIPSIGWVSPNQADAGTQDTTITRITMYRMYNQYTGEHFYTPDADEKANLVEVGWTDEGVGWYAPWFAISKSDTPVYRLYNPYAPGGDHHYTSSKSEYDSLKEVGWTQEGVGWYSVDGNDSDKKGVYRQYNSNAFSCNHNYTIDTEERDELITVGWNDEGIGWYGYASKAPSTTEIDFTKASVDTSDKTYNATQFKPSATIDGLTAGKDYTVTYGENKNAGTGTITIKGTGNYTGSKTYTFKINPADITNATITLDDTTLTYNAKQQTKTVVSVVVDSLTLTESDYTVSGSAQTNAGDYTLKVTGKGNFIGEAEKTFTILQADPVYAPTGLTGFVGEKLSTVNLPPVATNETPAKSIGWSSPETVIDDKGNKSYAVTFVPEDNKNYKTTELQVSVLCKYQHRGYWLGTKDAGVEYTDEAYFEEHDTNYLSGDEIQADMTVLRDASNAKYATVKSKWDKYYADDVRLYATYKDGEKEGSYDVTSATDRNSDGETSDLNKYVEFRILEVSGATGHALGTSRAGNDKSVVTFMATHVLPTAYQMNSEKTNVGGWEKSDLKKLIDDENGAVYSKFPSEFVKKVTSVAKEYNEGSTAAGVRANRTDTPKTVDCKFWIPSYTELVDGSTRADTWMPLYEGTQYGWCKSKEIQYKGASDALTYTTRAKAVPGGNDGSSCVWWIRSPYLSSANYMGFVFKDGDPYNGNDTDYFRGVVLAFCF